MLSSTVLTFDQPLRRFLKATLISSCTYIAFWQNVHCALEDFLLNPGKTGRSCSFSRRKISRKNSGTKVRKNWCSRILFRLSYHWRLGNPITKLPPWNDAWKIFKNSCYFRCRKRDLTAGSKFYLSRYCFFNRSKKEVDCLLWVPWLASDSCFLAYSVVFPSLPRKQMQICPQIIYKDKHVCRNIRLAGNLNVFSSGSLRPSNVFARGQEDIYPASSGFSRRNATGEKLSSVASGLEKPLLAG